MLDLLLTGRQGREHPGMSEYGAKSFRQGTLGKSVQTEGAQRTAEEAAGLDTTTHLWSRQLRGSMVSRVYGRGNTHRAATRSRQEWSRLLR